MGCSSSRYDHRGENADPDQGSRRAGQSEDRNNVYTGLLDVSDRGVDFQCLADRLAGLRTHVVAPEAGKGDPIMRGFSGNDE